ncbi:MAG TPA: GNAT family N-acetyltransferase [Candidatus Binatia bacterium]|jgi:CelD/BcsL family acetyltransferase involved in cellulose biosynthesis
MIEKVDTTEAFEKLKDTWGEVLEASSANCFFLTWEWLFTWWTHLAGERKLFILTVRSGDKAIGIAPLVERPVRFGASLRSLEFLASGAIGSDYLDLIVRSGHENEAVEGIAGYLAERKLMLALSQLGSTALAWRLARTLEGRSGYRPFPLKTDICPYIDLAGQTWTSYLSTLGSSHRANFLRRCKQIDRGFQMRFARATSEETRREFLAILLELHRKRWSEKGSSEAFSTPDMIAFHQELSRLALERGWLRLFVLWLNERPAAALYGFCRGGRFYFFQSGLDPEYSRYSVGLVTMGLAIKSALEERAEEYDLLHGDESYKFLWAARERGIHKLELYPPGVAGLVQGNISHAGHLARRIGWTILPKAMAEKIATARRMAQLKGHYATQSR